MSLVWENKASCVSFESPIVRLVVQWNLCSAVAFETFQSSGVREVAALLQRKNCGHRSTMISYYTDMCAIITCTLLRLVRTSMVC